MFNTHSEIEEFRDKEYREAYADDYLNTRVASQIRAIREQRDMTQQDLAESIGTHQAGVSRIENVNYSGWSIRTLKKIAHAFDCRLHISFETYGSLLERGAGYSRRVLQRPKFEEDPKFKIREKGYSASNVVPFPVPTRENLVNASKLNALTERARKSVKIGSPAQGKLFSEPASGVATIREERSAGAKAPILRKLESANERGKYGVENAEIYRRAHG